MNGPRTAFYEDHPCQLVRFHAPRPVITEYHHTKPEYLQKRLYGHTVYGPDLWVCSNCHEAIHAWLYFLMGERKEPQHVGRSAKRSAEATLKWFISEKARLDYAG